MLVKTYSAAVNGLEVTTVTVEISLMRGVMFHLSGLADAAVKESHDRIVAALQNNGYKFPVADITVNMAPPQRGQRLRPSTCHRHPCGNGKSECRDSR